MSTQQGHDPEQFEDKTEKGQLESSATQDATRIVGGIEWFTIQRASASGISPQFEEEEDCQCARCGSSVDWIDCGNCDEYGYSHHNCGEDCCCCLHPENNVPCDWCGGKGGSWHCMSGPEWCEAHPLPDRAHITSTALKPEAWRDDG